MMHKAMRSTRGTGRPGTRLWRPPPHSRCLHSAGQAHGRNLRTLLQLGYGACVLLRLGGLWPGLRGLTIKLPLIAFPAGVNAEGVMVFVNARSARGRATERQVIEVHPPAAVPRVQWRVRCKAQVLQVRLGFVELGGRLRWPQGGFKVALGGGPGGGLCGSEGKGLGLGAALRITSGLAGKASSGKPGASGHCVQGGEGQGFGASVEAVSGLAGNVSWEGTGAGVESAGGSSGASWSAQGFSSLLQG